MERHEAVARLGALLSSPEAETANTSMRLPVALRDAALLAVNELGAAASTTALVSTTLRSVLEGVLVEAVLADHYAAHPEDRPSLAERALAAALLDGSPMAGSPDEIERAAAELSARRPDASPDEVVLWAEARATPEA